MCRRSSQLLFRKGLWQDLTTVAEKLLRANPPHRQLAIFRVLLLNNLLPCKGINLMRIAGSPYLSTFLGYVARMPK
ncbi:hypothetical protein Q669_01900 [Labrenzia sp. C1B10]|nr:hypothetical protein Q669_01900 [Labrenzia sp. C1B10]ERS05553.1 hypothetical protein Q675_04025 [Labrenzia sp. C1B70]